MHGWFRLVDMRIEYWVPSTIAIVQDDSSVSFGLFTIHIYKNILNQFKKNNSKTVNCVHEYSYANDSSAHIVARNEKEKIKKQTRNTVKC